MISLAKQEIFGHANFVKVEYIHEEIHESKFLAFVSAKSEFTFGSCKIDPSLRTIGHKLT